MGIRETSQNQSCSNDLLTILFGFVDVGSERLEAFFIELEFKRFSLSTCRFLAKFFLTIIFPEGFLCEQRLHEAKAERSMALGALSVRWEISDNGSSSSDGPFSRRQECSAGCEGFVRGRLVLS